jgi:O-antigen/teichoic acid export membrane protein
VQDAQKKRVSFELQAIAGLKWSASAKLVTQVVSWAVTLLVIRLLTPADYGLMALSAVVLSILSGIAELGLGASVIQSRELSDTDLRRVAGALLVLNVVCFIAACASAPLIASVFGHAELAPIVRVAAIQLVLNAFAAIPESLAYRHLRFGWLAVIDIATGLTTSAATLGLALAGAGVWALVLGSLLGCAVRTVLLLVAGGFVRPSFRMGGIGPLLRFGGAWSGARFAWQLTYQADVLIAGRFLAEEAVGAYSVAVQLANMPLQKVMVIVNQVAFPAIARLQEELPRVRHRLLYGIRLLTFAAIPCLWGLGAVAPELVDVVLGEQWLVVVLPLQLIAIVTPLRMLANLLATATAGLGRADVELVNTLVSLVVFVGAYLIGVRFGVGGLAAAYVAGTVVSFALNVPRNLRVLGMSLAQIGAAARGSALSGASMIAAVTATRLGLVDMDEAVRLPLLVGVGAVVYVGMQYLLDREIWGEAQRVLIALRQRS